jgi:3-deoxy-D-manno-octulosonic-acid transferase
LFYLGGTFVTVGGHNLLEPAAWGIASIVGPHHRNCAATLQELQRVGGGFVANSEAELVQLTQQFLSQPNEMTTAGDQAARWLESEATRCGVALAAVAHELSA